MTPIITSLGFFFISTTLAATAYKWTGVNPHRVEDGPTWFGALWSGLQASLIFFVAVTLIEGPHTEIASFLYYYACGSVIAPAFWTSFTPSPEEEPNSVMRWWKGKLNGIGDGIFKSLFTIPFALLFSLFMEGGALFWATILFASALSIGKMGVTMPLIEADADNVLVKKRRGMLILGNVIATAIIGTVAMLCWAWLAHAMVDKFPPIQFADYIAVLGLLSGVLFHTL